VSNVSDAVARVYAQALLEVAVAQNCVGRVHEDLHAVESFRGRDPQFRAFFQSPRIDRRDKWAALEKALRGQVCAPVLGLVRVLILRGRSTVFDNIVRQFDRHRDLAEHRIRAYVTTAVPMGRADVESLRGRLAAASGMQVEIHERVDPAVLGGAAIRIGDRRIDRTLRRRLAALRERMDVHETESTPR
jgi:F-type H+-transporting ATPase subunit delta